MPTRARAHDRRVGMREPCRETIAHTSVGLLLWERSSEPCSNVLLKCIDDDGFTRHRVLIADAVFMIDSSSSILMVVIMHNAVD